MGLLAHIAGGALQGLGNGIVQDAAARRDAALQAMRIKYQQDKDANDQAVTEARRKEDRANKVADDAAAGDRKMRELGFVAQSQQVRDEKAHSYKVDEIKTTQAGQMQLAEFNAKADQARDAYKAAQERGEIMGQPVVGKDGQFYGVTKSGQFIPSGIMASPTAAAQGDRGGGRLTDAEQKTAFADAKRAWRDGGGKGPAPKESDYIGMTRADYDARRSGGGQERRTGTLTPSMKPDDGKMSDAQLAVSQLLTSYATATPETYPGLFRNGKKIPLAEAKRMVEQRYK